MIIEHKNSVTLPKDYFARKVKLEYEDWSSALVREFHQNSADSFLKVKRQNENIDWLSQGDWLTVTDNGCGMNKHTIENVLLSLLETDKGEQDTGGFGIAKELLYFSRPEWNIRTRNLIVTGNYIDYTIEELDGHFNGTRVRVKIVEDVDLFKTFKDYIKKCSFSQKVTWNGEQFKGMGPLGSLKRLEKDDEYYSIYEMPYRGTEVYIRSNGTFMFSQRFRKDKGIIFEIAPGQSKHVLTSNRDGLRGMYKELFNLIIDQLSRMGGEERSLFVREESEGKRWAREYTINIGDRFDGKLRYELGDISNIFYDNDLEGNDIEIQLDSSETGSWLDENGRILGYNAHLSEDGKAIEFEKVLLPDDIIGMDLFKCGNVTLIGRTEQINLPPKKIYHGLPYDANQKIYDGTIVISDCKVNKPS